MNKKNSQRINNNKSKITIRNNKVGSKIKLNKTRCKMENQKSSLKWTKEVQVRATSVLVTNNLLTKRKWQWINKLKNKQTGVNKKINTLKANRRTWTKRILSLTNLDSHKNNNNKLPKTSNLKKLWKTLTSSRKNMQEVSARLDKQLEVILGASLKRTKVNLTCHKEEKLNKKTGMEKTGLQRRSSLLQIREIKRIHSRKKAQLMRKSSSTHKMRNTLKVSWRKWKVTLTQLTPSWVKLRTVLN